jgi:hypothetical protein
MELKNLKKKSAILLPNVCDFKKENHILGYGLKTLEKNDSLAYGFLFFVISISRYPAIRQ